MVLSFQPACTSRPDPRTLFDQIQGAFLRGDLVRARRDAHRAYQQFSVRDPGWAWKFRLLEAEVMTDQGLGPEVLSLLDSPPPLNDANIDLHVQRQMLRALAFAHLGDFAHADQNFQDATRLCKEWTCESAGKLARIGGAVEIDENHIDEAAAYFLDSMRIARQRQDRFLESSAQLNLGVVALGKEHYDESVNWSDKAQQAARAIGAGLDEEKALGNLGWDYYKMGDFERSLANFKAAVETAHNLDALKDETIWLNNIGLVYFRTNQPALAGDYYRRSLALAQQLKNTDLTLASLNALAFLSVQTGALPEATSYTRQAFDLAHSLHDYADELYALLAQGQIAAQSADLVRAESLFRQVANDPASDTSLRWESQNSLAKLLNKENRPEAADRQYQAALSTVEKARSSIQHEDFRLPFLSNAAHLYDDYIDFLVKQGKPLKALQEADYSRAQTLSEGLGWHTSNARKEIEPQRLAAKTHSTILFYWLGPEHSYVWAITPRQTRLIGLPPATEIDSAVERYRKALIGPRDPLETSNADGLGLYQTLIQPARQFIPTHSRVTVIPDGSLDTLNFEALLVSAPSPHYWIDDVTVATASSLKLLGTSASAPPSPGKLLLVGDPVASDSTYGELPNASVEISDIEKHFAQGQRQVYARDQATPAAYLASHPEQFAFIHFVAHGTASKISPMDSGVVLSRTAGDNSSKLYARDIVSHPLRAELVTVSTCYGAGTRYYTGEGLVGLSWAFLRAGAHNVVGALWEVSDASTPELMDHLYAGIQQGQTPEVALRAAKLQMLHSSGVFRKPYYWAPFQLYAGP